MDGAHVGRDGHLVVVEDGEELAVAGPARVVEGLVAQAARERTVAEDCRHAVVLPREVPGRGHAVGRREGRGGVARAIDVVLALGALEEPRDAAILPNRLEGLPATRQNLVDVGLVAHVPDREVLGGLEDVMKRHRELHDPEAAGEVPAHLRDDLEEVGSELLAELGQGLLGQGPERLGGVDRAEERVRRQVPALSRTSI